MRKILWALFVLTLVCGSAGIALAAESVEPAAPDVALDDLMVPATESCDAPAVEAEEQLADLESQLLQPMAGQPCNQTTCTPQEFCCNFSCSICAPRGGFCIQIICE